MIYRRGFLKGLFAAVPLGAAAVIAGKKPQRPDPLNDPEAFQLDLKQLSRTDPALLGYREEALVAEGVKGASALALSPDGSLYVAMGSRVFQVTGGAMETEADVERRITAAAVTAEGTVWAASGQVLSAHEKAGQLSVEPVHLGERAYVTSLAVGGGKVFAADAGQRTVWILAQDGAIKGRIDGRRANGEEPGFVVPSPWFSVAAASGELWVTNPGRQRVERYTDGRLGGSWGYASMGAGGFCGCCNPTHLALLPDGGFVTSEKGIPRVKVYNANGEIRSIVAGAEDFDEGTTGLALAACPDGRIIVLDPVRGQVRSFTPGTRSAEV